MYTHMYIHWKRRSASEHTKQRAARPIHVVIIHVAVRNPRVDNLESLPLSAGISPLRTKG